MQDSPQERMRYLEKTLEYHSRLYYELDAPQIADSEYDAMFEELKKLEAQYPQYASAFSPTARVGGRVSEKFQKAKHIIPMGSLTDVFSLPEVFEFDSRIRQSEKDAEYVVECKIDGLSVSLEYENGKFIRGLTRGDGMFGEDVSSNIATIRSIPLKLSQPVKKLIVRGETYMPRSVFASLNKEREEAGQAPFANPRNAAAGSLRQLDSSLCAKRKLACFVFNLQYIEGEQPKTHKEALENLQSLGFTVSPVLTLCKTAQETVDEIVRIGESRDSLSFDTDGAVIKVNDLDMRERIGETVSVPKWAIAYKYPPETAQTVLRDIVIQVGRTGVLTPKAILDPVRISGSRVSQATLHNIDFIREKDLRIGDTVLLRKAGEIIPEIFGVIKEKRPQNALPFEMPEYCPSCNQKTVREEGEAAIRCVNPYCKAQLLRGLTHFISRDAMNIETLGESTAALLLESGKISGIADIYTLKKEDIATLPGLGEKSADNILASVEKSRSAGLERLLYALGIRNIGEKAAQVIASRFGNMERLLQATEQELCEIQDIGPESACAVLEFLHDPRTQSLIKALADLGVSMECKQTQKSDALNGKTIVITGTLPTLKRSEAEALIRENGGNASSSVSKKTDYLLCGADAGTKLAKAQELNIKIIGEEEFLKLIK